MVGRLSVCLSAQSINKSGRRVCCWAPALAADINQQCCRRRHSAANAGSVTLRGSKWSWLIATDRPASHPDCQCSRRADIDSCSSTSTMPSTAVSSNTTWQPNTTREYSTRADSSFWTELWVNTLLNLLTQRKKQFIYKFIDTHARTHARRGSTTLTQRQNDTVWSGNTSAFPQGHPICWQRHGYCLLG